MLVYGTTARGMKDTTYPSRTDLYFAGKLLYHYVLTINVHIM